MRSSSAVILLFSLVAMGQAPERPAQPALSPTPTEASPKPVLDLSPDANGSLAQAQMQQLFRVVAANDLENDKIHLDYTSFSLSFPPSSFFFFFQ